VTPDFVQLHNHSQYSKFDGFSSIPDMVKTAKKHGMTACGLTDHGTFAGAIEFLRTCRKEGIRPVLGMEAYLSKDHCAQCKEDQPAGRRGNRHINLIAKNYAGFQNICSLSQTASLDGFYYDPRLDAELLWEHREGVIATSACLSNTINTFLADDQYDLAKKAVASFKDIYGEDFYLEMMFHGIDREAKILPEIQRLSKDMDVKIIITNDCHYIRPEDAEFHEVIKIADKCDYSDIIFVEEGGTMKLPNFAIPENFKSPYDYLEKMAKDGLIRLGLAKSERHVKRLDIELSDIKLIWDTKRYDFSTYFLVVEDIMRFAKKSGIDAGVRGSGYGSLLLKCIGIVEGVIDPLEFDLLWERFLGFDDKFFLTEDDFGPTVKIDN
jgi:DNA polymerase-3 subunit alpha